MGLVRYGLTYVVQWMVSSGQGRSGMVQNTVAKARRRGDIKAEIASRRSRFGSLVWREARGRADLDSKCIPAQGL